ncbi:MAG: hypothetical protein JW855_00200 [Gammaproteobacteria bacterium]|nr:hypothetical protein [Gammaproteobacteria bacterium]
MSFDDPDSPEATLIGYRSEEDEDNNLFDTWIPRCYSEPNLSGFPSFFSEKLPNPRKTRSAEGINTGTGSELSEKQGEGESEQIFSSDLETRSAKSETESDHQEVQKCQREFSKHAKNVETKLRKIKNYLNGISDQVAQDLGEYRRKIRQFPKKRVQLTQVLQKKIHQMLEELIAINASEDMETLKAGMQILENTLELIGPLKYLQAKPRKRNRRGGENRQRKKHKRRSQKRQNGKTYREYFEEINTNLEGINRDARKIIERLELFQDQFIQDISQENVSEAIHPQQLIIPVPKPSSQQVKGICLLIFRSQYKEALRKLNPITEIQDEADLKGLLYALIFILCMNKNPEFSSIVKKIFSKIFNLLQSEHPDKVLGWLQEILSNYPLKQNISSITQLIKLKELVSAPDSMNLVLSWCQKAQEFLDQYSKATRVHDHEHEDFSEALFHLNGAKTLFEALFENISEPNTALFKKWQPLYNDVLVRIGSCYLSLTNFSEALGHFHDVFVSQLEYPKLLQYMSYAYVGLEKFEEAARFLEENCDIEEPSKSMEALVDLFQISCIQIYCYTKIGKNKEAETLAQILCEKFCACLPRGLTAEILVNKICEGFENTPPGGTVVMSLEDSIPSRELRT